MTPEQLIADVIVSLAHKLSAATDDRAALATALREVIDAVDAAAPPWPTCHPGYCAVCDATRAVLAKLGEGNQ